MLGARVHERIEQMILIFDGMVQFPTQRTHEVNPQRAHAGTVSDGNLLCREPRKRLVGNVGVCELLENVARLRSGQHEHAILRGRVFEIDRGVRRQELCQEVEIVIVCGTRTNQEEPLTPWSVAQSCDGEFGPHRTRWIEGVRQGETPHALWHVIGDDLVQPIAGAGTLDFELRER